jgi:hypothetical protein
MYSSLSRVSALNSVEPQSLSFCTGLKLLESGCVENVLQVGFHLSGVVWTFPPNSTTSSRTEMAYPGQPPPPQQLPYPHNNFPLPPVVGPPMPHHNNHPPFPPVPYNNNNNNNMPNPNDPNMDRDGFNSISNQSVPSNIEENKKYKVSVSFDR